MKIYNQLAHFNRNSGPVALTIGNFDGIHLGHQRIMKELTRDLKFQTVVISFEPHPIKILKPEVHFMRLFPFEDQAEQLEKLQIGHFIRVNFDRSMSEMGYESFLDLLWQYLDINKIIVGYDFKFGKNQEGNIVNLEKWCQRKKIIFLKMDEVKIENSTVSTSEIKRRLQNSAISNANVMLGRSFYLKGVIIKGDQRGRLLGFPTANLGIESEIIVPGKGVYATQVTVLDKEYFGVTNIGKTPTFKDDERIKIETHILNFDQEIYGEKMKVEFLKFIRDEKKFSSVDEIKLQIKKDISESRND